MGFGWRLTCGWLWGAGVLRGRPRTPALGLATVGAALRDLTVLVDGAAEGLRFRLGLAGAWTSWCVGVDATGESLALLECCASCDEKGRVNRPRRRPLTCVTISLNITYPQ